VGPTGDDLQEGHFALVKACMMLKEEKVTVIVPVYNTELYLERCLSTIVNQSYKNLEIILIDDGSMDSSPRICDSYAEADHRIKVIHKENGGQSSARNRGLDIVSGDWILFVDSDDWIALQTIESCLKVSEEEPEADMIMFGCAEVRSLAEADFLKERPFFKRKFNTIDLRRKLLKEGIKDDTWFSCWRYFFRSKVLEELRFREGKINEDIDYIYKAMRKASIIFVINPVFYYYFQGTGSTTTSLLRRKDFDLYDAGEVLVQETEKDGDREMIRFARIKQAKTPLSLLCKAAYFGITEEFQDKKEIVEKLRKEVKESLVLILTSNIAASRKILAICFSINYNFTKFIIQLGKKIMMLFYGMRWK
jgi:putative glycosyltransferase